jgi:predicted O-methyltransferase YrrM
MVRRHDPARIVEVGSGHSTRFLARAVSDGALKTRITAIDPMPRASLEGLPIELLSTPVQTAGRAPFENLRAGDFLFVDSSQQCRPGSDVEFIFEQILPALPRGAFVHFHDIFLPGAYPEQWSWRRYNEQPLVAALIAGGGYSVEFSSAWIIACRPEGLSNGVLARLPLLPGALESSIWLRRTG